MPVLPTSGSASGFWLSPTAIDATPISGGNLFQTSSGSVRHRREDGTTSNRGLAAQVSWPTPCASEAVDQGTNWASLKNCDKGGRIARAMATRGTEETQQTTHAALNPSWVEWLMNWAVGWTSLEPMSPEIFNDWKRRTEGCAEGSPDNADGQVRALWWDQDPADPPHRPQPNEQHAVEPDGAMCRLPREDARQREVGKPQYRQGLCELRGGIFVHESETEDVQPVVREHSFVEVPRVKNGVANRVDRLRAIGNGQVPACAALAFRILSDRIND